MSSTNNDCIEPKRAADWRRLVDETAFEDEPGSTATWEKLRKHLQACPACRARYNKAAQAARLLGGGPAALGRPSEIELARIGAAVVEPDGPAPSAWARFIKLFAPSQRWSMALVAGAAILALLPLSAKLMKKAGEGVPAHDHPGQPGTVDDELQPRGGAGKPDKGGVNLYSNKGQPERQAALRAFCLVGEGAQQKVEPLDPLVAPGGSALHAFAPRCALGGQLKLAIGNGGKFARVFLVGVDDRYQVKWYAPRPPEAASVAAPQPSTDDATAVQPLGAAVRLAVNHGAGALRIFALFSDRPVTAAEVEAAAAELGRARARLADTETLPLSRTDVVQRSLLVDLAQ